jgi:hypothetical protein
VFSSRLVAHEIVRKARQMYEFAAGFGELFGEQSLQPVQGQVHQGGRDDAPLRRTGRGGIVDSLVDETCFEPLPKNRAVHRDMGEQPWMRDFIETTFYIAFEHISRRVGASKQDEALPDRISHGPPFPKSIGVRVGGGFRNRIEGEQMQRLTCSVYHGRNSERPHLHLLLVMPFRNEDTPERLRFVIFNGEILDGSRFLIRRVEQLAVYSGSAFAGVRNVSITLRHLGEKFRLQQEAQRPFPAAAADG